MTNYKERLLHAISHIANPTLAGICRDLVNVPCATEFTLWPASLSHHHARPEGLLRHTAEVCAVAQALLKSESLQFMNSDVVLTACVWHDYGKVREYVLTSRENAANKRSVESWGSHCWIKGPDIPDKSHPHIEWSANAFVNALNKAGRNVREEVVECIVDCILSHHGRVEWGSPFAPKTREAVLVHQADMISAQIGASK